MSIEFFTGWDIGGAHLKLARVSQAGQVDLAMQKPMPLWQGIEVLEHALAEAVSALPRTATLHAVTLTAELADIFHDRSSGVAAVTTHICHYLPQAEIRLYGGRSGWVIPAAAALHALDIASANWHATASYAARFIDAGVLVDIGSTTTDIVMFNGGKVRYHGYTDCERLANYELVYTGVVRTPVIAVAHEAPLAGKWQPLVAELFATMADVYRLTGALHADDDMQGTPDGQGKTVRDSARRLARMFGTDVEDNPSLTVWRNAACALASIQLLNIERALQTQLSRAQDVTGMTLVGAGVGSFLARQLAQMHGMQYLDFSELCAAPAQAGKQVARAAAAVAVAQLARMTHENPAS